MQHKKIYILKDYCQGLVNRTFKTERKIDNWPVHPRSIDYLNIILNKCKDLKKSDEYLNLLRLKNIIRLELSKSKKEVE